jgi:hypothetical protein
MRGKERKKGGKREGREGTEGGKGGKEKGQEKEKGRKIRTGKKKEIRTAVDQSKSACNGIVD